MVTAPDLTDLDYENPIVDIVTAEQKEPDWLVPGVFPVGQMICIGGESGAGKSLLLYMISLALATGVSTLSGVVPAGKPRKVLYFDDENSELDRDRYLARCYRGLEDTHGAEPDLGMLLENFFPIGFRLGDEDWYDTAAQFVERIQPDLIVYDTATVCFGIVNENDNGEAMTAIRKVKKLARSVTPYATSVVLRHANRYEKGGQRDMRGAKQWKGQSDQVLFQAIGQGRRMKNGLVRTKLIGDKARAFGMTKGDAIHITPSYTDSKKSGLVLEARLDNKHRDDADEDQDDDE